MIFAWDDKNRDHIAEHNVSPGEAEDVVRGATAPFPRSIDGRKFMIWGQTRAGRYLQVIIVFKMPEQVSFHELTAEQWMEIDSLETGQIIRVIHAMDLPDKKKQKLRKRRRSL